jgi:NAD-dependent histone deacetylase SIR2
LSERSRKTGYLRASVVLYGEEHPQGELIGSAVERDLKGTGKKEEKEGKVDLLLVAGTSLSIPGVKRIVKEMARALHGRKGTAGTPRVLMINREMPKGKEWEEVFDTFIAGDIQEFAEYCSDPAFAQAPPTPATTPKKRKVSTPKEVTANPWPTPSPTPTRKRTRGSEPATEGPITPIKRRPISKSVLGRPVFPPTPESLEKTQSESIPECSSPLSERSRPLHDEDL